MKKLTILVALLGMLLSAFTPLVLAQQTPPEDSAGDIQYDNAQGEQ